MWSFRTFLVRKSVSKLSALNENGAERSRRPTAAPGIANERETHDLPFLQHTIYIEVKDMAENYKTAATELFHNTDVRQLFPEDHGRIISVTTDTTIGQVFKVHDDPPALLRPNQRSIAAVQRCSGAGRNSLGGGGQSKIH
jgi:hypothetical protein